MANYHNIDIQGLAIKMVNGDTDAKNKIINYYTDYINNIINTKFKEVECDKKLVREKMVQCLYNCINNYSNIKDKYFSNYIGSYINRIAVDELKKIKNKAEFKDRKTQQLLLRAFEGNECARDEIIQRYSYHLKNQIKSRNDIDDNIKEDLIQIGIIGILKCLNNCIKNKNLYFTTYVWVYTNYEINKGIGLLTNKKEYIYFNDSYNDFFEENENKYIVEKAMENLTDIEKKVLHLYFWKNYSFVDIANLYNFSHQNACKHYKKAIQKIKKYIK